MRDQKLKINDDWEHEFSKDLVYLQEEIAIIEHDVEKYINKQPARIIVIDTDKILERHNEPHINILPF